MLVEKTAEKKQTSLTKNILLEEIAIYMIARNKAPAMGLNENVSKRRLAHPQFFCWVGSLMVLGALLIL